MIPVFGEILPGVAYQERPGAYALISNAQNELAVIRTSMGFFLPGGGIDPGETSEQGLRRELLEEIGYELVSCRLLGRAVQFHWSEFYQTHFKKIGAFFRVEAKPQTGLGYQAGHDLRWWSVTRAGVELSQEFQRWAVLQNPL